MNKELITKNIMKNCEEKLFLKVREGFNICAKSKTKNMTGKINKENNKSTDLKTKLATNPEFISRIDELHFFLTFRRF